MDTQQNPNEPGKPNAPGQQGGQQQDRDKQEVTVNSASVKNKVAVNRVAASKADDKIGSLRTKRAAGGNSRRFFMLYGEAIRI